MDKQGCENSTSTTFDTDSLAEDESDVADERFVENIVDRFAVKSER